MTSLDLDPIATAREIAGPEAAEELRKALDTAGQ